MHAQFLDRIREETQVITVNAMLNDGWVLLDIAHSKQGHTYILGKRTVTARQQAHVAFQTNETLPTPGTAPLAAQPALPAA